MRRLAQGTTAQHINCDETEIRSKVSACRGGEIWAATMCVWRLNAWESIRMTAHVTEIQDDFNSADHDHIDL